MSDVDGFAVPIPEARLEDYRHMAELACQVWMEHGALEYREWIADDVPDGEVTSFPLTIQLKDGEIVGFADVRCASREHRDAVMKRVLADERLQQCSDPQRLPFDGRRLILGGFKPLVSSEAD